MRKEVILAIIIGVVLGGIILYGINLANKSSETNTVTSGTEGLEIKASPSPTQKTDTQISIITPQDKAVVTESVLTLKGSAEPSSNIAIITESDDILISSDQNGNFSSDINLINGENLITVTMVDSTLATSSSSVTIIRTASLPE